MGLLDPVGPEEPRTYWIRRAIVGGVAVLVVVALIVLVVQLRGGDDTTPAEQPPPTAPSLQPAETPSDSSEPSDDPSDDPSDEPSKDPSGEASKKSSKDPSKKPTDKDTASKEPTKKSSKSPSKSPAKPAACDPSVLRTTLTGPKSITPEKEITFKAGVINGGDETCTFTLDPDSYVFRVHSGTDQIWTTENCTKWLPKVEVELKPEEDVTWKIDWTVQRSKDCDLVDTKLKPGTYAANSLLDKAPPAQLVMQLK